ncbi:hypothetical protein V6N12_065689 [Hibiscus sabdariffa]|uniref:Uncharacterized protein n=1 Tax=Hibiscus sabdariffa TaxID=183260 RepID=A0ABR2G9X9_9ROSI
MLQSAIRKRVSKTCELRCGPRWSLLQFRVPLSMSKVSLGDACSPLLDGAEYPIEIKVLLVCQDGGFILAWKSGNDDHGGRRGDGVWEWN